MISVANNHEVELHYGSFQLRHILPAEACIHHNRTQLRNQGICKCKSKTTERDGGDQRLAVAMESISNDADACQRKRGETKGLRRC